MDTDNGHVIEDKETEEVKEGKEEKVDIYGIIIKYFEDKGIFPPGSYTPNNQ